MIGLLVAHLLVFFMTSWGVGAWLAVRLPEAWTALQRLIVSLAASWGLLFGFSLLSYQMDWPASWAPLLFLIVSLLAMWSARRELVAWSASCATGLTAWGIFIAWALVHLALLRNFSGGTLQWDWLEHYERAHFFLEHQSVKTLFLGYYDLAARPPLMNAVVAHALALVDGSFASFQLASLLFGAAVFLPALGLVCDWKPPTRKQAAALLLFFALNPMMIEHLLYPWTRQMTNTLVLTGLGLYLYGYERKDPLFMLWSAIVLALAATTHYSAIPYWLAVFLHQVWGVFYRRDFKLSHLVSNGFFYALVFSPWFCWALWSVGPYNTFHSNTTMAAYDRGHHPSFLMSFVYNFIYTMVPFPLRSMDRKLIFMVQQVSTLGFWRDWACLIFQTNFVFAFGGVGTYLLGKKLLGKKERSGSFRAWSFLVPVALVICIAVNDVIESFGIAHICLQPLVYLGLIWLARDFVRQPRQSQQCIAAGVALSYVVGFGLQTYFQSLTFTGMNDPHLQALSEITRINWDLKIKHGFVFWGDLFAQAWPRF